MSLILIAFGIMIGVMGLSVAIACVAMGPSEPYPLIATAVLLGLSSLCFWGAHRLRRRKARLGEAASELNHQKLRAMGFCCPSCCGEAINRVPYLVQLIGETPHEAVCRDCATRWRVARELYAILPNADADHAGLSWAERNEAFKSQPLRPIQIVLISALAILTIPLIAAGTFQGRNAFIVMVQVALLIGVFLTRRRTARLPQNPSASMPVTANLQDQAASFDTKEEREEKKRYHLN